MTEALRASVAAQPDDLVAVPVDEHRGLSSRVLEALGVPAAAAREQADLLLEGDLRGHPSHGLRRLDMLVQRIRSGVLRTDASPLLTWRTPSALEVDGRQGLGPPTARVAVRALLDRVPETGVAVAAIGNANHLGMLAPYVEDMAQHGVIGIAVTTSEALVHPWGGRVPMIGTNPLAIAIPTGGHPFVLDMATGEISMGKVLDHAARGLPLPEGAAVDEHGVPTTDAAAAAAGAITPFGGAKGYALAVALEVLVASLTGTALGQDVRGTLDPVHSSTKGDLFIALDPGSFRLPVPGAVDAYLDAVRTSAPAQGRDAVLVPGDRSRAVRESNRARGVPVAATTWARAQEIARSVDQ